VTPTRGRYSSAVRLANAARLGLDVLVEGIDEPLQLGAQPPHRFLPSGCGWSSQAAFQTQRARQRYQVLLLLHRVLDVTVAPLRPCWCPGGRP
jgi:hypothetical protein